MKIPLNIEKNGFVTVFATLRSEKYHAFRSIKFLIDTGSPKTFISETDANLVGIPVSRLEPREFALLAGTKIGLAPLQAVRLSFRDANGEIITLTPKEFFAALSMRKGLHSLPAVNSIIGSDFLKENEFALYFNPTKNTAYLEREDEENQAV